MKGTLFSPICCAKTIKKLMVSRPHENTAWQRKSISKLFVFMIFPPINTDPNIPETGDQLAKSNNGPDSCCYEYCHTFSVYRGICSQCDSLEVDPADNSRVQSQTNNHHSVDESTTLQQRYDSSTVSKLETPPQTCQLVPGLSLTTSRCEIPYYASSFDATRLHSIDTSTPATVSTETLAKTT